MNSKLTKRLAMVGLSASMLLQTGCGLIGWRYNPRVLTTHQYANKDSVLIPTDFKPTCDQPEFHGYNGTCWDRWPEGWVNCPEECVSEQIISGVPVQALPDQPGPVEAAPDSNPTKPPVTPPKDDGAKAPPEVDSKPIPGTPPAKPEVPAVPDKTPMPPVNPAPVKPAPVVPMPAAPATPAPVTPAPAVPDSFPAPAAPETPAPTTPAPVKPKLDPKSNSPAFDPFAPANPPVKPSAPKPSGSGATSPATRGAPRGLRLNRSLIQPKTDAVRQQTVDAGRSTDIALDRDEALGREAISRLQAMKKSGELQRFRLNLQVASGTAYVTGNVVSKEQKQLVYETIRKVPGIRGIQSRVVVERSVAADIAAVAKAGQPKPPARIQKPRNLSGLDRLARTAQLIRPIPMAVHRPKPAPVSAPAATVERPAPRTPVKSVSISRPIERPEPTLAPVTRLAPVTKVTPDTSKLTRLNTTPDLQPLRVITRQEKTDAALTPPEPDSISDLLR